MKKTLQIILPTSINFQKPKPGGIESYIRSLVKNIIKYDVQITILCVGTERKKNFNGKVIVLPVCKEAKNELSFFIKMLFKKWFGFFQLPDEALVIANGEHYCIPFLIFTKKNKLILTAHGAILPTLETKKGRVYLWFYEHLVEKFIARKVDKIIAVNEDAKKYFSEKYPFLSDKILKIPIGVDTTLFNILNQKEMRKKYNFKTENKIIIYVGRLAKEKRIDLLLESFKDIENQIDANLLLVGSGPEEKFLKKLAFQLKLKNVIFHGPERYEKVSEIMNCADVLALCSEYEEMPTVVLEALACGIPVVSTDVGDVKQVVNNKTGHFVKEASSELIKNALLEVIRNGRDTYSESCLAVAKRYSWEHISQEILEVYAEVIGNCR